MNLKYIEFVKVDGKQVSFDVVQVSLREGARCFHIDVHADTNFQFVMCKSQKGEWEIITDESHELSIVKFYMALIPAIEKRLQLENDYLGLS